MLFLNQKKPFYVVVDNVRSLENIGAIFRTADDLAVTKIFLCGISGFPPSDKISKTALGAQKTVPFEYQKHCWRVLDTLSKNKVMTVALEQTEKSIVYDKFKPRFPLALVIGNEIKGVSRAILKRADKIVYLPMLGRKESLNVAVAFGVIGYEFNKKRFNKGRAL